MSKPLAEGDRIRVADREQTAADIKSQLFYDHYRGLSGTISKVYADGTASVNVDNEALTKEVAQRHVKTSEGLRQKWLDGISEEGRNKLSASEKTFTLRYTILVALTDLSPYAETTKASMPAPAKAIAAPADEPRRKTLEEIEAEEAKHLEEIKRQNEG
jgi:hypothetical protein